MWKRSRRQPTGTEQIRGYRELDQIGRGGFSVVYRAYQEGFDRTVAVKVLTMDHLDLAGRRRFLREVQLTARLTGHPNVVTVLDSGLTSWNRPYLAMPYFDAGSLNDRLTAEGPLPVADVLRVGVKIAGALGAAHREGMLHRDVKPQNILISRYGEPALADFGTARLSLSLEASTRSDALTPYHAAPEVLQGDDPSVASDIYSLGSTLYQLLSGRPPYLGDTGGIAGHLLRVLTGEPTPLLRSDVPPELVTTIRRAMARDPADRPADAFALAAQLRDVQRTEGLAVTDAPATSTAPAILATVAPAPVTAARPRPEVDLPDDVTPPATPGHALPTVRVRISRPRRRRWLIPAGIVVLAVAATATPLLLARHPAAPATAGLTVDASRPTTPPSTPLTPGPRTASPSALPLPNPSELAALAPRQLTVVADGGSTVSLRWQLAPDARLYPLLVQSTPAGGPPRLSVVPPGASSFTVTGLDAHTGYCFQAGLLLQTGTGAQPPVETWSKPACIRGAAPAA